MYDPEHEIPKSKKPKRKRLIDSEREYHIEALKFDPQKTNGLCIGVVLNTHQRNRTN